jgi:hypothetical protein
LKTGGAALAALSVLANEYRLGGGGGGEQPLTCDLRRRLVGRHLTLVVCDLRLAALGLLMARG